MIWTEWDKLTEVIVGRVYDPDQFANEAVNTEWMDNEFIDGFSRILQETNEDLDNLSRILQFQSIKVHRPKRLDYKQETTRMLDTFLPFPAVCPRDLQFAYGNNILSTVGSEVDRFNESDFFTQILTEKFREGRNLLSMPQPLLSNEEKSYSNLEGQILYHSANLLKIGDAILYSVPYGDGRPGKGTYAGLDWIKRNIGYDVEWVEFQRSGHADGGMCLIKPGLLMVKDRTLIPSQLSDWDVIEIERKPLSEYFNTITERGWYKDKVSNWLNHWMGKVGETIFDINGLSIDSETLMTNGYDRVMAAKLKEFRVELVPFDFRHRYFWDSGLHCVTLDLSREGSNERYIDV